MPAVLFYQPTTGQILMVATSTAPAVVDAQPTPPGLLRYPQEDMQHPAVIAPAEWYVSNGTLVQKAVLTVTATPNPFVADGVDLCMITVDPVTAPLTILINGVAYQVTPEIPSCGVASTTPQTYRVYPPGEAQYWFAEVYVTSTAPQGG